MTVPLLCRRWLHSNKSTHSKRVPLSSKRHTLPRSTRNKVVISSVT
jgi:hypothetical protein